ncbi:P-loop containing nucleoside triphosphate hydrolase protein [Xylariaceae sp. FL0255]|nr:P-loop containing nucleoside triphosphate hydrolase protein [Xylariaceae sp. FL0255]
MKTTWKDIAPVPTAQEFLDIVLSRTQRRLPTQIRSGFKISRIRAFYTRKVKFTAETFSEKLSLILEGFPRLNDLHPFHKDLMNTLYDADHFRIALGQLATSKSLIESISRDYVRLLKYAQSLYQCKQLKRAALGRMATLTRRLKDPLLYLDQVRQHLGRLPSIDPTARTLLICGFPNTGKSSFLKSISRADVDVQPYAFTTKSLFVGHYDYQYLRFQAIDTPGVLDHPLEEMNTIEMQSVTAMAHLRAAILYFCDLSEQCGYSFKAQMELFRTLKPLFSNKLIFLVVNKIDILRPEELDAETSAELQELISSSNVEMLQLSCNTTEGVQEAKNLVSERLLAHRVSEKVNAGTSSSGAIGSRLADVMARIHVAQPMGGEVRESFIPDAVKNLKKFDKSDPERPMLARDVEEANGGAGVYNVDLKADYLLENPEWKHDKIPEIFDGKNIYDFVDPDIEAKLQALEEEEERLEAEGFYDSDEEIDDVETADIRKKADQIRTKQALIRNEARMRRVKNRAALPRSAVKKSLSQLEDSLDQLGVDTEELHLRGRSQTRTARGRSTTRSRLGTEDSNAMDVDMTPKERLRSKSRARSQPATNRRVDGVADEGMRTKAEKQAKLSQRKMNRMARQGEADRHTTAALPKHLFTGKRSMGKASHR